MFEVSWSMRKNISYWKILKYVGIPWNTLQGPEVPWDILKKHQIFLCMWSTSKNVRYPDVLLNMLKYFEIL